MTDPWAPAPKQSDPWAGMSSQQSDPWATSAQQAAPIPQHQMAPPSAEEIFAGGVGCKGFSFDGEPPMRLGGPIVEMPPARQKQDFDTGELLFWKDGRPRWILPVHCQTSERVDADDDGVRAHYLEYRKLKAVQEACKRVGKAMPEVGGALYLTYLAPKPARGQAKSYTAEYFPPGTPDPYAGQQFAPAPAAQPQAAPAPAGPPPQAQIAMQAGAPQALAQALCAAGMTVEEAQRLPGLAAGWQNATAEQIMPYIRRAPSSEPPF